MKYTYAYKTSDGVRHESTVDAPSRDAAFAALRSQGIKPIKVVAADGSKANGEVIVRGVRKRIVTLVVVVLLFASAIVSFLAFRAGESLRESTDATANANNGFPTCTPRHQIYGDPAIVDEFERGKFDLAVTNRLDEMLAWFAQPGKLMCPKGTDPRRMSDRFASELSLLTTQLQNIHPQMDEPRSTQMGEPRSTQMGGPRSVAAAGDAGSVPPGVLMPIPPGILKLPPIIISESDPREVRELKQIVNGLREEMSAYLANGNGTPRSYWHRLIQRTQQEVQIYERTKRELEREKSDTVWEQKNESLRLLGLRTIPKPDEN